MNSQVLARKWRPKTFSDVIGQEHVLTAITNSLLTGRIHHAWLFSGLHGVGKTSIARLLAKSLNCKTSITSNPCGTCDHCRAIEKGCFIDFVEFDAASRTKVEDTRDLLDNLQYSPVHGRFRIYLIDEVHMLSRYSFNALLKTLEEPPAHVKFLLATTDHKKIPITILSRCLHFHLKVLNTEQIFCKVKDILTKEGIEYDFYAIRLLARAASGSLRDALRLTDQAIANGNGKLTKEVVSSMLGTLNDDQALSLIEAIFEANGKRVMMIINNASAKGIAWEELLVEMQSLLHRIAMIQLSFSAYITEDEINIEKRIRQLARTIPPTDIQLYYQILLIGRKELPFAPSYRMGVEMTLLRALAFHPEKITELPTKLPNPCSLDSPVEIKTPAFQLSQKATFPKKMETISKPSRKAEITVRTKLQNIEKETKLKKDSNLSP